LSVVSSITHVMLQEKKSISETLEEINHYLNFRCDGVELVTFFISIYNKKTKEFEYINAGHRTPILIKKDTGELSFLEGKASILGALPNVDYSSSTLTFNRGDEMILYTDGLVEIYNDNTGEDYNDETLMRTISESIDLEIEDKLNSIIEKINLFKNGSIRDDIIIIGIEVL
ncbi:MAG: PP2C family protein-serine/threonine phosphatase, partial [Spirochaetota bacterium]|nr:PP2C family protein-serine/threonine phosphatase [Spirochaetota bacterium]